MSDWGLTEWTGLQKDKERKNKNADKVRKKSEGARSVVEIDCEMWEVPREISIPYWPQV